MTLHPKVRCLYIAHCSPHSPIAKRRAVAPAQPTADARVSARCPATSRHADTSVGAPLPPAPGLFQNTSQCVKGFDGTSVETLETVCSQHASQPHPRTPSTASVNCFDSCLGVIVTYLRPVIARANHTAMPTYTTRYIKSTNTLRSQATDAAYQQSQMRYGTGNRTAQQHHPYELQMQCLSQGAHRYTDGLA